MMTNFDKWKEGLTAEDLILPDLVAGSVRVRIACYENCPVKNCPVIRHFLWLKRREDYGYSATHRQGLEHCRLAQKCATWFLRWANAPAKEEE